MSWLTPAIFTLTPHVGSCIGGALTDSSCMEWYAKLNKPSFTPPDYIFGPVWMGLYTSIGYASWMVYRDGGGFHGAARLPLTVYGASLVLQSAYAPVMFGLKRLGLGTANILLLTCGAAGSVYTFHPVNSTASYMLLPWLGWLSFASLLNLLIWKNNTEGGEDQQESIEDDDKFQKTV